MCTGRTGDERVPSSRRTRSTIEERARWAAVTREDLAGNSHEDRLRRALRRTYFATEHDDLIPIVHSAGTRRTIVRTFRRAQYFADFRPAHPIGNRTFGAGRRRGEHRCFGRIPSIWRRDRRRTVTVEANPIAGVTLPTLRQAVLPQFDALAADLPPGYTLEWGGDSESAGRSNQSLIPGMVPALALMAIIVVGLFNAFRPPLIILCLVPFALIGATLGLLLFNVPFGFMALLGGMSLVGMMIKNAIVLLDEIDLNLANGEDRYDAVLNAGVSRLNPVMMAAATTVLGVIPLLPDVFWQGLAVTIMGGLTVGTFLIMIPFWWACWTAWQTGIINSKRSRTVNSCSSQKVVIGTPLTNSITKKGRPVSVVPASKTRAMFG